ncbi:MAG: hypothetical protein AABY22_17550 [Nanoarchaeota archaeon]
MAKEVVLDTNFILACVKEKIDFIHELQFVGLKVVIPEQILAEIVKIILSKEKLKSRKLAETAVNILERRKFKTVVLRDKDIDRGLEKYVKEHDSMIATLDRELKKKLKGRVVGIVGKKIERV